MKDNNQELLPRVDEYGNVIGSVTRGDAHGGSLILHPVVHLHVFNSNGDIFLQHRPSWKTVQPDKWDTACGGHIAYGESVPEALKREVAEELGIFDYEPVFLSKYIFESGIDREFVYVFKAVYDGVITPDRQELDGGRFFTGEELLAAMGTGILTPNFESEYRMFF